MTDDTPPRSVPARRVPVVLLAAFLAVACGGDAPPAGNGSPGDGGSAVDSAPATGAPIPGPTAILDGASHRSEEGELRLLDRMPPATDTAERTVPNRHLPGRTDTIRTLRWEGLELEVHVAAGGKEILRSLRVTGHGYATDDGLSPGVSRQRVRELRGDPDEVDGAVWRYTIREGERDPTPTTLEVTFEDDTVAALEWELWVD